MMETNENTVSFGRKIGKIILRVMSFVLTFVVSTLALGYTITTKSRRYFSKNGFIAL